MNALLIALLGGSCGAGLAVFVVGIRGIAIFDARLFRGGRAGRLLDRLLLRASLAAGCGLVLLAVSNWPVLALAGAGAGWWLPSWPSTRGVHAREIALVEAIATWTEHIRDTLAAANGLEHALGATAPLAPAPIAAAVGRLAARSEYERLPDALRRFADEVDHPLADFVVAALVIAAEKEARDLGALLGQLAESSRDEARMRTRVWVGRARSRSAVRIIIVVVVAFVLGLLLFNREYLHPYDSVGGQLMLTVILAVFGCSFVLMHRIGLIKMPERFVVKRADGTELRGLP